METHKTLRRFKSQEDALNFIKSKYDIKGEVIDRFAVPADGLKHSSPALSYRVSKEEIRFVHALSTGHVVIRFDVDSGRGVGPHSDQENPRDSSSGHPW